MDNEEVRVTSDEREAVAEEAAKIRMSRADALSVLANLARKRDTTLEEVVAIQIAVRNVAKRMFDRERHLKRKYGPKEAAAYHTPAAALDFIAANPELSRIAAEVADAPEAKDEVQTTKDEGAEVEKTAPSALWRGRRKPRVRMTAAERVGVALDVYRSCPDGVEFARSDVLPAFLKTESGMSGKVSERLLSVYLKMLAGVGALRNRGFSITSRYFKVKVGESALARKLEKGVR